MGNEKGLSRFRWGLQNIVREDEVKMLEGEEDVGVTIKERPQTRTCPSYTAEHSQR
jgi:hypothetical protein